MESCSLHSPTIATASASFTKGGIPEKTCAFGQVLKFPCLSNHPHTRKLKVLDVKAQTSGTWNSSSQAAGGIPVDGESKDENLAFVAGATGRVGSRTVRELLKLGFRVRAAVRSAQRAEALVQSVKQMKVDSEGAQPVERLEIVECDLEQPKQIGPALGNSSVVLCCIGAGEKEVFDVTGPYRIDYIATKNLVDAATIAKVKHFIMVSSLGTNKIGFPAAILNLFWGVLIWKRKAEEALIASGVPYTIVRPGGMERPTDAYKETHNLLLSEEDTLFGGQVSNLQVAELMAFMAKNRRLSYCKVVEAIAETTAPLTPMDKLLEKIPSQRVLPKELDAEDQPEPAASEGVVPEASSSPTEKQSAEAKAIETKPLSPYTAYDDLKPPTSPTLTKTSGQKEIAKPVDAVSKSDALDTQISSPEVVVASTTEKQPAATIDLKPPSSPRPTPSGPKEVLASAPPPAETESPPKGSNDVAQITASDIADKIPPQDLNSGNSPYQVYEDLKPPTSPTLTTPDASPRSASFMNGGPKTDNSPPTAPNAEEQTHTEPKPRPLSPYTMYDDMKPPTTPSPSPRK